MEDPKELIKRVADLTGHCSAHISLMQNYVELNDGTVDIGIEETAIGVIEDMLNFIDNNFVPHYPSHIIIIQSAIYYKTAYPDHKMDVTLTLKTLANEKKKFHVNPFEYNKLFGDPFPWFSKTLKVLYLYNRTDFTKIVTENQALVLP